MDDFDLLKHMLQPEVTTKINCEWSLNGSVVIDLTAQTYEPTSKDHGFSIKD